MQTAATVSHSQALATSRTLQTQKNPLPAQILRPFLARKRGDHTHTDNANAQQPQALIWAKLYEHCLARMVHGVTVTTINVWMINQPLVVRLNSQCTNPKWHSLTCAWPHVEVSVFSAASQPRPLCKLLLNSGLAKCLKIAP